MKTRLAPILTLILLAACAAPPQHSASAIHLTSPQPSPSAALTPTPMPTPSAVVTTFFGSMSFVMPASWQEVTPRVWTVPVGPRLFLSNAPIADPCALSERGPECWKPLAELPPSGILVTFAGSATTTLPNPSPVAQEIAVSGWCQEIGGERALTSNFPGFGVIACLRGPNLAANEALFDQLLISMKRS